MLIETLQRRSGISRSKLNRIAFTASMRYKSYEIEKRNGQGRLIHQPSKKLKSVQRWITAYLFNKLPLHPAATAYHKGASIKHNAQIHSSRNYTLRMDFTEFFPSFSYSQISKYLADLENEHSLGLTNEDREFVCAITTRKNRLTIGAPSSPALTNVMMHTFDEKLFDESKKHSVIYSRYADDLFFSSNDPKLLKPLEAIVCDFSDLFPYADLRINKEKTLYLSKQYRRTITGLVITSDNKVSLGRQRKRKIKALLQKFRDGQLNDEDISSLKGLFAFAGDVEPTFVDSLIRKYGSELIDNLYS